MKKIVILFVTAIALCSCTTKFMQVTTWTNFGLAKSMGVTISTSACGFSYEPIGELNMLFKSGIKDGYVNPDLSTNYTNRMFYPDSDYIVKEMAKAAKSKGADAILNFKIDARYQTTYLGDRKYVGATATGLAVKLKQ